MPFVAIPVPNDGYWGLHITKDRVIQSICGTTDVAFELAAPQTVLWRYPAETVEQINVPLDLGCPDKDR